MKNLFPGYYKLSQSDYVQLWAEATFVCDTNVLLNIYRYTPQTQSRFLEIMKGLNERIWVPYQAALEFHRNRLSVISSQTKAYDAIKEFFTKTQRQISSELGKYRRHPYINIDTFNKDVDESISRIIKSLDTSKEQHPDLLQEDELLDIMADLFDTKVGSPHQEGELEDLYKIAEKRFKGKQPPGYEDDKEKSGTEKYGDVIIWFEIINLAKTNKKPIVFVTDDKKGDWWLQHDGKTVGPRPELIQEIFAASGVRFHMYQSDTFLLHAEEFLGLERKPNVVKEVRDIKEFDQSVNNASAAASPHLTMRSSRFDSLIYLTKEYQELVDIAQSGALNTDEIRSVSRERSIISRLIKDELDRLGLQSQDETEAIHTAFKISRWIDNEQS